MAFLFNVWYGFNSQLLLFLILKVHSLFFPGPDNRILWNE